ncbi:MAG: ROK family protein [Candidatus Omnitrophica bacterium]|nr:ROK family protein [Candidatus Omnitrophota bacterium]
MLKKRASYLIGMDIGGTKILTGVFDRNFKKCLAREKTAVDANKGRAFFLKSLRENIESVLDEADVKMSRVAAIGAGCPGMIQNPGGIVRLSPNIAFLRNFELGNWMSRAFKVPVTLENDVNAGAYGEQQFGAAKGFQNVINIFLGTGVGGGLILDGKLYRGMSGAAGEIGHMFLNLPAFCDGNNRLSTFESYVGRHAISTEAAELILKQKAPFLLKKSGSDVRRIKSKALAAAIIRGDTEVRNMMIRKARILGIAMANAVNLLNPERIVLGGGVIEAMGGLILSEATRTMRLYALPPMVKGVSVASAKLGDDAIIYGGAKLALDFLLTPKIRKGSRYGSKRG